MRTLIFGVMGGLALFIYGMDLMGDGLKKVAGDRLRQILEAVTRNPVVGILVGTAVTMVIQSSSATTVLVIGFVNAGLMSLPQAIGLILGATIGTTITAQLIAFDVGQYAYPLAALGFVFYFFGHRRQHKFAGQVILGFGILFIGLNTMSGVLKPLADSALFVNWITSLGHHRYLGVLVGLAMTLIVQSSSATIGVLQSVAAQPIATGVAGEALIPLKAAIPILLGDNIGTTITALLASIGANRAAKRAAVSHALVKIVGTIICLIFFSYFVHLVISLSPQANSAAGITGAAVIKRQIANAHTLFNLVNTLIWLPLVGVLVWIVRKLIPGEDPVVEKGVKYLDPHVVGDPSVALRLSTKELGRMGDLAQTMLAGAERLITPNQGLPRLEPIQENEDVLDELQARVIHYLSTIVSRSSLTEKQSNQLTNLMHVTGDIERVGDHCMNIGELALYKAEQKVVLSEQAQEELQRVFALTAEMFDLALQGLVKEDLDAGQRVISLEKTMNQLEEEYRRSHLDRLSMGTCNPKSAVCYTEIMKNLERIADHCNNIAEAVLDQRRHSQIK